MKLQVKDELCSGCRVCELLCAMVHFKQNNYRKAAIRIRGRFPVPGAFVSAVCDQCGDCAAACPVEAIEARDGVYVIREEDCNGCGACVEACSKGVMFTHASRIVPIKCDACGECVEFCPREALSLGA